MANLFFYGDETTFYGDEMAKSGGELISFTPNSITYMSENINVLVIEDEPIWSNYLVSALKKMGYNIAGVADNIDTAIGLLNTVAFDIAMVDITLDGKKSGIQIGKLISQTYKKPFIFITSDVSETIMTDVVDAAPAAYLPKPVNTTALTIAINNALYTDNDSEPVPAAHNDSFFVKLGSIFKKVKWSDVICLSVSQNYTQVVTPTSGNTLFIRSPLHKTLTEIVPRHLQRDFIRINRGEVINARHIEELHGNTIITQHGRYDVTDTHLQEVKKYLHLIA